MLGEYDLEQDKCHECGRPRSVCSDPERKFYPQRSVCHATMERQAASDKYDDLHDTDSDAQYHDGTFTSWSGKRSRSHPYRATSGVTFWVSDVDLEPDATWLSGRVDRKQDDEAHQSDDDD